MKDVDFTYLAAAIAYHGERPAFTAAETLHRTRTSNDPDYAHACERHRAVGQALHDAEAAWVASWR
jgi:hypothetical protein